MEDRRIPRRAHEALQSRFREVAPQIATCPGAPARGVRHMSGKDLHNKREFDSVPTPEWLLRLFDGFPDPYALRGDGIVEPPPPGAKVFANPGYSRKLEAASKCIKWHRAGH